MTSGFSLPRKLNTCWQYFGLYQPSTGTVTYNSYVGLMFINHTLRILVNELRFSTYGTKKIRNKFYFKWGLGEGRVVAGWGSAEDIFENNLNR